MDIDHLLSGTLQEFRAQDFHISRKSDDVTRIGPDNFQYGSFIGRHTEKRHRKRHGDITGILIVAYDVGNGNIEFANGMPPENIHETVEFPRAEESDSLAHAEKIELNLHGKFHLNV